MSSCFNLDGFQTWLENHNLKKKKKKKKIGIYGGGSGGGGTLLVPNNLLVPTSPVTINYITTIGTTNTSILVGWSPPTSSANYLFDIEVLLITNPSPNRISSFRENTNTNTNSVINAFQPYTLLTKYAPTEFDLTPFASLFEPTKSYQISIIPTNAIGQRNKDLDLSKKFVFGYPRLSSPIDLRVLSTSNSSTPILSVRWDLPNSIPETAKGYVIQVAPDAANNQFLQWKNLYVSGSSSNVNFSLENNRFLVLPSLSIRDTLSLNVPLANIKFVRVAVIDEFDFIGAYSSPLQIQTNKVLPGVTSITGLWVAETQSVDIQCVFDGEIVADIDALLLEWNDPNENDVHLQRKTIELIPVTTPNPNLFLNGLYTIHYKFQVPLEFVANMQTQFYATPRTKTNQLFGETKISPIFQRPMSVPEKVNFQIQSVQEGVMTLQATPTQTGGSPLTSIEVLLTPENTPYAAGTGQIPQEVSNASIIRTVLNNPSVAMSYFNIDVVGWVPTQSYRIQARASNVLGPGPFQSLLHSPFRFVGPPSTPTNVVVTPRSNGALVKWSAPRFWGNVNEINYDVSPNQRPDFTYLIQINTAGVDSPVVLSFDSSSKDSTIEYALNNNLVNGKSYQVSVKTKQKKTFLQPNNNTDGGIVSQGLYESPYSTLSEPFIPFGVPLIPQIVNVLSLNQSFQVDLLIDTFHMSNGRPISDVEISIPSSSFAQQIPWDQVELKLTNIPNVYRFVFNSLNNGQFYVLAFRLKNEAGYSDLVQTESVMAGGLPTASPFFQAYVPSDGALEVSLIPPPLSALGDDVYELQLATDTTFASLSLVDVKMVPQSLNLFVSLFQGLVNETPYFFRARTINSVGLSSWSTVQSVIASAPPSLIQPTIQSIDSGKELSKVSLNVLIPAHSAYHPTTRAFIQAIPTQTHDQKEAESGATPFQSNEILFEPSLEGVSSSDNTRTIVFLDRDKLKNGWTYTFSVFFKNAAGVTSWSNLVQADVGSLPVLFPLDVSTTVVGDQQLHVKLGELDTFLLSNNGGYHISSMKIEVYDQENGSVVQTVSLDENLLPPISTLFHFDHLVNGKKYVVFARLMNDLGFSLVTPQQIQSASSLIPFGKSDPPRIESVNSVDLTPEDLIDQSLSDIGFEIQLKHPINENGRPVSIGHLFLERVRLVYDLAGQASISVVDEHPIHFLVPLDARTGKIPTKFIVSYEYLIENDLFQLGQFYRFWVLSETEWGLSDPSVKTIPVQLVVSPAPLALEENLTQNMNLTQNNQLALQLNTSPYLYQPTLTGGVKIKQFEALLYKFSSDPVTSFVSKVTYPLVTQSTIPLSQQDPTVQSSFLDILFTKDKNQVPLQPGQVFWVRIVSVNESGLSSLSNTKGPFYLPLPGLPFQSVEPQVTSTSFQLNVSVQSTLPTLPTTGNFLSYGHTVLTVTPSGTQSSQVIEFPILSGGGVWSQRIESSENPMDNQKLILGETYRLSTKSVAFPIASLSIASNPVVEWGASFLVTVGPRAPFVSFHWGANGRNLIVQVQRLQGLISTGGSPISKYILLLKKESMDGDVVQQMEVDDSIFESVSSFEKTFVNVNPLSVHVLEVYALNQAFSLYGGVKGASYISPATIQAQPVLPNAPLIQVISPKGVSQQVTFQVDLSPVQMAKDQIESVAIYSEPDGKLRRILFVDKDWSSDPLDMKVNHTLTGFEDGSEYQLKANCKIKSNSKISAFSELTDAFKPGSSPLNVLNVQAECQFANSLRVGFQISNLSSYTSSFKYVFDVFDTQNNNEKLASFTFPLITSPSMIVSVDLKDADANASAPFDPSLFYNKLISVSVTCIDPIQNLSSQPVFSATPVRVFPLRPFPFPSLEVVELEQVAQKPLMLSVNQLWQSLRTNFYNQSASRHPTLTFGPSIKGGDVIGFVGPSGSSALDWNCDIVGYKMEATSEEGTISQTVYLSQPLSSLQLSNPLLVRMSGLTNNKSYSFQVTLLFGFKDPSETDPTIYFSSDPIPFTGSFRPIGIAGYGNRPYVTLKQIAPKWLIFVPAGSEIDTQGDTNVECNLRVEKVENGNNTVAYADYPTRSLPIDVTDFLNQDYNRDTQTIRFSYVYVNRSKKRPDENGNSSQWVQSVYLLTNVLNDLNFEWGNMTLSRLPHPHSPETAFYQLEQTIQLFWDSTFGDVNKVFNVKVRARLIPLVDLFPLAIQNWLANQGKTLEDLIIEAPVQPVEVLGANIPLTFEFQGHYEYGVYRLEVYSEMGIFEDSDPTETFRIEAIPLFAGPVNEFVLNANKALIAPPFPVSDVLALVSLQRQETGLNLSFVAPLGGLVSDAFEGEINANAPRTNVKHYEVRMVVDASPPSEWTQIVPVDKFTSLQHRQSVFLPFELPTSTDSTGTVFVKAVGREGFSSEAVSFHLGVVPARPSAIDPQTITVLQPPNQELIRVSWENANPNVDTCFLRVVEKATRTIVLEREVIQYQANPSRFTFDLFSFPEFRFRGPFDISIQAKSMDHGTFSKETVVSCNADTFQPLLFPGPFVFSIDDAKDQAVCSFSSNSDSLREILIQNGTSLIERESISLTKEENHSFLLTLSNLRSNFGLGQTIQPSLSFVYAGLVPHNLNALPAVQNVDSFQTPSLPLSGLPQENPVLVGDINNPNKQIPFIPPTEAFTNIYVSNAIPDELLVGPTVYKVRISSSDSTPDTWVLLDLETEYKTNWTLDGWFQIQLNLNTLIDHGKIKNSIPFSVKAQAERLDRSLQESNLLSFVYVKTTPPSFSSVQADTYFLGQLMDADADQQADVTSPDQVRVFLPIHPSLTSSQQDQIFDFYKGTSIELEYILASSQHFSQLKSFQKTISIPSSLSLSEFKSQFLPGNGNLLSFVIQDANHQDDSQVYSIRARWVESPPYQISNWTPTTLYCPLFSLKKTVAGDWIQLNWDSLFSQNVNVAKARVSVRAITFGSTNEKFICEISSPLSNFETLLNLNNSFPGDVCRFILSLYDENGNLLSLSQSRDFVYKPLAPSDSVIFQEIDGVLSGTWNQNSLYQQQQPFPLISTSKWLVEYSVGVGSNQWSVLTSLPNKRNEHSYQLDNWFSQLPSSDQIAPFVYSFRVTPLDVFESRGTSSNVSIVQALTPIPSPIHATVMEYDPQTNSQFVQVEFSRIPTDSTLVGDIEYALFLDQQLVVLSNALSRARFPSNLSPQQIFLKVSTSEIQQALQLLGLDTPTQIRFRVVPFLGTRQGPDENLSVESFQFILPSQPVINLLKEEEGKVLVQWDPSTSSPTHYLVECIDTDTQQKVSIPSLNERDPTNVSLSRAVVDFFKQTGMRPQGGYQFRIIPFSLDGFAGAPSPSRPITGLGFPTSLNYTIQNGVYVQFSWSGGFPNANPSLQTEVQFLSRTFNSDWQVIDPAFFLSDYKLLLSSYFLNGVGYQFKIRFKEVVTESTSIAALSPPFNVHIPSPASSLQVTQQADRLLIHVQVPVTGFDNVNKWVSLAKSNGTSPLPSALNNSTLQAFLSGGGGDNQSFQFIPKDSLNGGLLTFTQIVPAANVQGASVDDLQFHFKVYVIEDEHKILQSSEPIETIYQVVGPAPDTLNVNSNTRGTSLTCSWPLLQTPANANTLKIFAYDSTHVPFDPQMLTEVASVDPSLSSATFSFSSSLFAPNTLYKFYTQSLNGTQTGALIETSATFSYQNSTMLENPFVQEENGSIRFSWSSSPSSSSVDVYFKEDTDLQWSFFKNTNSSFVVFSDRSSPLLLPGHRYLFKAIPRELSVFQMALESRSTQIYYYTYPLPSRLAETPFLRLNEVGTGPELVVRFLSDYLYPESELPVGSSLLWRLCAVGQTSQEIIPLDAYLISPPIFIDGGTKLQFIVSSSALSSVLLPSVNYKWTLQSYPSHDVTSSLIQIYHNIFQYTLAPAVNPSTIKITGQITDPMTGQDVISAKFASVSFPVSKYLISYNQTANIHEILSLGDGVELPLSILRSEVLSVSNQTSFDIQIQSVDVFGIVGQSTGWVTLHLMQMPTYVSFDTQMGASSNLKTGLFSFILYASTPGPADRFMIEIYRKSASNPALSYQKMESATQYSTSNGDLGFQVALNPSDLQVGDKFFAILTPMLGSTLGPSSQPPANLSSSPSPDEVLTYTPFTLQAVDLIAQETDGFLNFSWQHNILNPSAYPAGTEYKLFISPTGLNQWVLAKTLLLSENTHTLDPLSLNLMSSQFDVRLHAFHKDRFGVSLNYLELSPLRYLGGFGAIRCVIQSQLDETGDQFQRNIHCQSERNNFLLGEQSVPLIKVWYRLDATMNPFAELPSFSQPSALTFDIPFEQWFTSGKLAFDQIYEVRFQLTQGSNTGFKTDMRIFVPSLSRPLSPSFKEILMKQGLLTFRISPSSLLSRSDLDKRFTGLYLSYLTFNIQNAPTYPDLFTKYQLVLQWRFSSVSNWSTALELEVTNLPLDGNGDRFFTLGAQNTRHFLVDLGQNTPVDPNDHPDVHFRVYFKHPSTGYCSDFLCDSPGSGILAWLAHPIHPKAIQRSSFTPLFNVNDPTSFDKVKLTFESTQGDLTSFGGLVNKVVNQYKLMSNSTWTFDLLQPTDTSVTLQLYQQDSILTNPFTPIRVELTSIVKKDGVNVTTSFPVASTNFQLFQYPIPAQTPRFIQVVSVSASQRLKFTFPEFLWPLLQYQLFHSSSLSPLTNMQYLQPIIPVSGQSGVTFMDIQDMRFTLDPGNVNVNQSTMRIKLQTMDAGGYPHPFVSTPNKPDQFTVFPSPLSVTLQDERPALFTADLFNYYTDSQNVNISAINPSSVYDFRLRSPEFASNFGVNNDLYLKLNYVSCIVDVGHIPESFFESVKVTIRNADDTSTLDVYTVILPFATDPRRQSLFPNGKIYLPLSRFANYFSNDPVIVRAQVSISEKTDYFSADFKDATYTIPPIPPVDPNLVLGAFIDPANNKDLYVITENQISVIGVAFSSDGGTNYSAYGDGNSFGSLLPIPFMSSIPSFVSSILPPNAHVFKLSDVYERSLGSPQQTTNTIQGSIRIFFANSINIFSGIPVTVNNLFLFGNLLLQNAYSTFQYTPHSQTIPSPNHFVQFTCQAPFLANLTISPWLSGFKFSYALSMTNKDNPQEKVIKTANNVVIPAGMNGAFSFGNEVWSLQSFLTPDLMQQDSFVSFASADLKPGVTYILGAELTIDFTINDFEIPFKQKYTLTVDPSCNNYEWSYSLPSSSLPTSDQFLLFSEIDPNQTLLPYSSVKKLYFQNKNVDAPNMNPYLFFGESMSVQGTIYPLRSIGNAPSQSLIEVQPPNAMLDFSLRNEQANIFIARSIQMRTQPSLPPNFDSPVNFFTFWIPAIVYKNYSFRLQPDTLTFEQSSSQFKLNFVQPFKNATLFRVRCVYSTQATPSYFVDLGSSTQQDTLVTSSNNQQAIFNLSNTATNLLPFLPGENASLKDIYLAVTPYFRPDDLGYFQEFGGSTTVFKTEDQSLSLWNQLYIPSSTDGVADQVLYNFFETPPTFMFLTPPSLTRGVNDLIEINVRHNTVKFYQLLVKKSGASLTQKSFANHYSNVIGVDIVLFTINGQPDLLISQNIPTQIYLTDILEVALVPFLGVPASFNQSMFVKFYLDVLSSALSVQSSSVQNFKFATNSISLPTAFTDQLGPGPYQFSFQIRYKGSTHDLLPTTTGTELTFQSTYFNGSPVFVETSSGTRFQSNQEFVCYARLFEVRGNTCFSSDSFVYNFNTYLPPNNFNAISSFGLQDSGELYFDLNANALAPKQFLIQLFFEGVDGLKYYLISPDGDGNAHYELSSQPALFLSYPVNISIRLVLNNFGFDLLQQIRSILPAGSSQLFLGVYLVNPTTLASTVNATSKIRFSVPVVPSSLTWTSSLVDYQNGLANLTFQIGVTPGASKFNLYTKRKHESTWTLISGNITPNASGPTSVVVDNSNWVSDKINPYQFAVAAKVPPFQFESPYFQSENELLWDTQAESPISFSYSIFEDGAQMQTYLDFDLKAASNPKNVWIEVHYTYQPLVDNSRIDEQADMQNILATQTTSNPILLPGASWLVDNTIKRFSFTNFEGFHGLYKFQAVCRNGFLTSKSPVCSCSTNSNCVEFPDKGNFVWAGEVIYLVFFSKKNVMDIEIGSLRFFSDRFYLDANKTIVSGPYPLLGERHIRILNKDGSSPQDFIGIKANFINSYSRYRSTYYLGVDSNNKPIYPNENLSKEKFQYGYHILSTYVVFGGVKHWSKKKNLFEMYPLQNVKIDRSNPANYRVQFTQSPDPEGIFNLSSAVFEWKNSSGTVVANTSNSYYFSRNDGQYLEFTATYKLSDVNPSFQNVFKVTLGNSPILFKKSSNEIVFDTWFYSQGDPETLTNTIIS